MDGFIKYSMQDFAVGLSVLIFLAKKKGLSSVYNSKS